jgi:hypothetical protein
MFTRATSGRQTHTAPVIGESAESQPNEIRKPEKRLTRRPIRVPADICEMKRTGLADPSEFAIAAFVTN